MISPFKTRNSVHLDCCLKLNVFRESITYCRSIFPFFSCVCKLKESSRSRSFVFLYLIDHFTLKNMIILNGLLSAPLFANMINRQEINLCLSCLPAIKLYSNGMKLNWKCQFTRGCSLSHGWNSPLLIPFLISFPSLPPSSILNRSDEFWWVVVYLGEALSPHC